MSLEAIIDTRAQRPDSAVDDVLAQWVIIRAIELADSARFDSARDVLAVIQREAPRVVSVLDNELMLCINERCKRARRTPRAKMRACSRANAEARAIVRAARESERADCDRAGPRL